MNASGPYTVTCLDADRCTMAASECDTLREAQRAARLAASEPEYRAAGMVRVEVTDSRGVCVFDVTC